MDIKILASGSSGNCYRVSDGKTAILLECGISIQKIRDGLNFKLSEIEACFITHEHKDHSKAVKDIARAGIDVYMSCGTAIKLGFGLYSHRINFIGAGSQFEIGSFTVLPFLTQHDAAEPLGFLICSNITGDKLVFATDTYYIKYRFRGLTHIMIECNYANDILNSNIEAGLIPESLKNRLLESHMSLDNCKEFLRANDLSNVKEIYLMHLSNGNSDEARFKKEIQELTGKQVIVC